MRKRPRDLAFVVGGLFLLAIAIPMAFDDRWLAAASVVFGVGLLAMPVAEWIGGGRSEVRLEGTAVVIDSLREKVWAGRLILTLAGASRAVYFVKSTEGDRWLGLGLAVCAAVAIGSHLRQGGGCQGGGRLPCQSTCSPRREERGKRREVERLLRLLYPGVARGRCLGVGLRPEVDGDDLDARVAHVQVRW